MIASDKFWSQVDKRGGANACWPWRGSQDKGYAKCRSNGKTRMAHHVAWKLINGGYPTCQIKRSCGNNLCINLRHSGSRSRPIRSELTDDDVGAIRALWKRGITAEKIGQLFALEKRTCWRIANGKRWKRVG